MADTDDWLQTLKDYGLSSLTLNVYLEMISEPSSPVQESTNSNILRHPIIKIYNTRDVELAQWNTDSQNCKTVNLIKFIQSELKIPIHNQVLYHSGKR